MAKKGGNQGNPEGMCCAGSFGLTIGPSSTPPPSGQGGLGQVFAVFVRGFTSCILTRPFPLKSTRCIHSPLPDGMNTAPPGLQILLLPLLFPSPLLYQTLALTLYHVSYAAISRTDKLNEPSITGKPHQIRAPITINISPSKISSVLPFWHLYLS